jgi:hypothetical protein
MKILNANNVLIILKTSYHGINAVNNFFVRYCSQIFCSWKVFLKFAGKAKSLPREFEGKRGDNL